MWMSHIISHIHIPRQAAARGRVVQMRLNVHTLTTILPLYHCTARWYWPITCRIDSQLSNNAIWRPSSTWSDTNVECCTPPAAAASAAAVKTGEWRQLDDRHELPVHHEVVPQLVYTRDRWIMRLCARIILHIIGDLAHNWASPA